MHFIQEQVLFFIAVSLVLFLPGFALLRSFFRKSFSSLELFIFSVPASIAIVNFLMIALGKSSIRLTAISIVASIFGASLLFVTCSRFEKIFSKAFWTSIKTTVFRSDEKSLENISSKNEMLFTFSKREGWLIILILTLTVFIKTVYLSQVILPTATDLGHHMYWSKTIAVTGELPTYVERNIVESNGAYKLDVPEPIDDFIIGEHLIFAAIALIAGLDFVSGFPAITLLLINIFTLLAIFLFVLRAFLPSKPQMKEKSSKAFWMSIKTTVFRSDEKSLEDFSSANVGISAKTIAITTLFFLGPLYTLASPQAKFVSGGVIGNTIGNLFIPVVLYCYWRALQEKSSKFLTLAFFLTFGLAYIHHLSTLIFLFIAVFAILTFSILNIKTLHQHIAQWFKIFFKPAPLLFALTAILFFFFVLAPSYADPKSLNTALGAPTKATRTGLTFLQFTFSTGEGRLGLGLVGLLSLLFLFLRQQNKKIPSEISYATAFFFAWGFSLLVMSLRPQWLFLDIPSNRISSYATFPFAILSALAFVQLFSLAKKSKVSENVTMASFAVIGTFFIVGGFYDNSQSLLGKTKAQEAIQTYRVSDYLAQHNQSNDLILKDHNYIVADSWMKLSFLQGYTYPLSRGYFKRYEDETKPREQCSLWMIAVPNTDKGRKCFEETGTNIVIVNPHFDSVQFKKSDEFTSVYQSDDIATYVRK